MRDRRYLEFRLKGDPFCAYPCGGMPDAIWNIYPVRGWRLRRMMRFASKLHLDRILFKRIGFPLETYGVSEEMFFNFINQCTGAERTVAAFAWPAPVRSENRIYAYAIGEGDGQLAGYLKIATCRGEDVKLSRERSAVLGLTARNRELSFRFPKSIGSTSFDCGVSIYVYQPLPIDASSFVRWSTDSWEKDILPIKNELSTGTDKHLSREEAYALDWVKRFAGNATKVQLANLAVALEDGMDVCATHGDMACQNFRYHEGKYWLFDWEEFTMDGPARVDELSFKLSTFVYDMGKTFRESVPEMPKREFIAAAAFQVANGLSFKKELGELLNSRIV